MKINLGKTELIHFVGIGGIGMSGLALIMNGLGFKVQGSDISKNKNVERSTCSLKFFVISTFLNIGENISMLTKVWLIYLAQITWLGG